MRAAGAGVRLGVRLTHARAPRVCLQRTKYLATKKIKNTSITVLSPDYEASGSSETISLFFFLFSLCSRGLEEARRLEQSQPACWCLGRVGSVATDQSNTEGAGQEARGEGILPKGTNPCSQQHVPGQALGVGAPSSIRGREAGGQEGLVAFHRPLLAGSGAPEAALH